MTRNFTTQTTRFYPKRDKNTSFFFTILALMYFSGTCFAEAKAGKNSKTLSRHASNVKKMTGPPAIAYSSPQTYKVGTAITPLKPTSTGVAAISYKATTNVIGSGFTHPVDIAVDGQGNVYVADDQNSSLVLKKIPGDGGSTVGLSGGFNGKKPTGVAVDGSGNVYGIDQGNFVFVDRIDNRTISGLQAGVGVNSNGPDGIAVDANRNVYVTNSGNNSVKKIPYDNSPDAPFEITTGFSNPTGIAVDVAGNVFVADQGSHSVKMIPAGTVTPTLVMANITGAFTVSADVAGNMYIVKLLNSGIQMLPVNGGATITVGANFNSPAGLAIGGDGKIYVADAGNGQVKTVDPTGGYFINKLLPRGLAFNPSTGIITGTPGINTAATSYKVTAFNTSGSGSANISIIVNTKLPPPHISYTSPDNFSLGVPVTLTPTNSGSPVLPVGYNGPVGHVGKNFTTFGVATIDAAGNIYVVNDFPHNVKKILAGTDSTIVVASGFIQPEGIAVDGAGNIFVADIGDETLKKVSPGGGTPVVISSGFSRIHGLAFNAAGDLFIADGFNIKKLPAHSTTPIIFSSGYAGPDDIKVDRAGNIYVIDRQFIVKISPDGTTRETIAAGFGQPEGIAIDIASNIFVADARAKNLQMLPAGSNTPVVIASAFAFPEGVVVDGAGVVYVADFGLPFMTAVRPTGGYFINALPAGMNFNNTTGAITGTPAKTSLARNYTVTAYNILANKAIVNIKVSDLHNANLSDLKLTAGTLSPAFTQTTTSYSTTVSTSTIKVVPTAVDVNAAIKVNGIAVTTGTASAGITLNLGDNNITIAVTALDGTTKKTYALKVTRLSDNALLTTLKVNPVTKITQVSGADYRDYTTTVPSTESSVRITPVTQEAAASVKVNGVVVASGTASAAIPLNFGDNTIKTVVTAPDGVTTKTYSINFTRLLSANSNLSNLTLSSGGLSPVFATNTINYTAKVSNATASITITPIASDAGATIKVNGTAVVSGSASASLPLILGSNTINTVVTAQDGTTTKIYTVTVTRAASNNAFLSTLKINPVTTLTVVSGPDYRDYATTVPNTELNVKVTATAQSPTSLIKINGVTVASGATSAAIPLNVGVNVIKTVVTAQDGVTVKTYSITFTRQAPVAAARKYEQQEVPITANTLTVHQNLSPNGDGNGDLLVIDGITAYPDNKMQIVNRGGVLVYEARGYDNTNKVFDGHSSTDGKLQQAGTYFYSLEYKDGSETRHKSGFILIKY